MPRFRSVRRAHSVCAMSDKPWREAVNAMASAFVVGPSADGVLAMESRQRGSRERDYQAELYVGSRTSKGTEYEGYSWRYPSSEWPPVCKVRDGKHEAELALVARVSNEPGGEPSAIFAAFVLNRAQAEWLLPMLQRFVDNGSVEPKRVEPEAAGPYPHMTRDEVRAAMHEGEIPKPAPGWKPPFPYPGDTLDGDSEWFQRRAREEKEPDPLMRMHEAMDDVRAMYGVPVPPPVDDWRPVDTAPKDCTHVMVKLKSGTVHEDAHWASDRTGEYQPPFEGWFVPDGKGFKEVVGVVAWRPR